jgi:hypothetical protein
VSTLAPGWYRLICWIDVRVFRVKAKTFLLSSWEIHFKQKYDWIMKQMIDKVVRQEEKENDQNETKQKHRNDSNLSSSSRFFFFGMGHYNPISYTVSFLSCPSDGWLVCLFVCLFGLLFRLFYFIAIVAGTPLRGKVIVQVKKGVDKCKSVTLEVSGKERTAAYQYLEYGTTTMTHPYHRHDNDDDNDDEDRKLV